jgi:hypothetical protein
MNVASTSATSDYSHLIGRNMHMSGTVTFDPKTDISATVPDIFPTV